MSVRKSQTATFKLDDESEQASGYNPERTSTVVVHENGGADRSYRYEKQMSRGQLFKWAAGISVVCGLLFPGVGWLTSHGITGHRVNENEKAIKILESSVDAASSAVMRIETKQLMLIEDVEENSEKADEVLGAVNRIEATINAIHED
jgi:hypothetical protein